MRERQVLALAFGKIGDRFDDDGKERKVMVLGIRIDAANRFAEKIQASGRGYVLREPSEDEARISA